MCLRRILRRGARIDYEPSILRMLHQEVYIERCRTFQYRVDFFQVCAISAIEVMLPKGLAYPSSATIPDSPEDSIYRARDSPDVGIVMGHPAFGTVHDASSFLTCFSQFRHHAQEWLMKLRQICLFSRPIVHLRIDVDGVFTVPRRRKASIPYSLEVGRLASGLGRGYQKVSSILII